MTGTGWRSSFVIFNTYFTSVCFRGFSLTVLARRSLFLLFQILIPCLLISNMYHSLKTRVVYTLAVSVTSMSLRITWINSPIHIYKFFFYLSGKLRSTALNSYIEIKWTFVCCLVWYPIKTWDLRKVFCAKLNNKRMFLRWSLVLGIKS